MIAADSANMLIEYGGTNEVSKLYSVEYKDGDLDKVYIEFEY